MVNDSSIVVSVIWSTPLQGVYSLAKWNYVPYLRVENGGKKRKLNYKIRRSVDNASAFFRVHFFLKTQIVMEWNKIKTEMREKITIPWNAKKGNVYNRNENSRQKTIFLHFCSSCFIGEFDGGNEKNICRCKNALWCVFFTSQRIIAKVKRWKSNEKENAILAGVKKIKICKT